MASFQNATFLPLCSFPYCIMCTLAMVCYSSLCWICVSLGYYYWPSLGYVVTCLPGLAVCYSFVLSLYSFVAQITLIIWLPLSWFTASLTGFIYALQCWLLFIPLCIHPFTRINNVNKNLFSVIVNIRWVINAKFLSIFWILKSIF